MNEWTRICSVADIPVLGARRVTRPKGPAVAVFRSSEDKVFALLDRCPHKGGPLSQGIVFGESVACPLHNWTIGLDDGCARGADVGCTVKFQVRIDGAEVFLNQTELSSLALEVTMPIAGPGASTGALGDESYNVQAPHSA